MENSDLGSVDQAAVVRASRALVRRAPVRWANLRADRRGGCCCGGSLADGALRACSVGNLTRPASTHRRALWEVSPVCHFEE